MYNQIPASATQSWEEMLFHPYLFHTKQLLICQQLPHNLLLSLFSTQEKISVMLEYVVGNYGAFLKHFTNS